MAAEEALVSGLPLRGTAANKPHRRCARPAGPAPPPCRAAATAARPPGRGVPASAASGLPGCAARSRFRSRAHRPGRDPLALASRRARQARAAGSGGASRSLLRPAPPAGASFESRERLLSVARMSRLGAAAASASALPPAPAQRSRTFASPSGVQASAISWLPSSCTSTRPSANSRMVVDAAVGRQADAPRAERRRLRPLELRPAAPRGSCERH